MKTILFILIFSAALVNAQNQNKIKRYFQKEFIEEKYHNTENKHKALQELGFDISKEDNQALMQNKSTNESNEIAVGAEPNIAVDPQNANHIAITFMDVNDELTFPVYYTTDGGINWTISNYNVTESFKTYNNITETIESGGDPVLAFDNHGNLYMSWLFVYNNTATTGFVVSTDGGANFSAIDDDAVVFSGNTQQMEALDREWLAVDNTGGVNDGTLYMSGFYIGNTLNDNGQVVFTKPYGSSVFNETVASASGFDMQTAPQFGNIKVDNTGNVHVSCMQYSPQDGSGTIIYSKSTDGAVSFTETEIASNQTQTQDNAILHDRENAAVSMAVDGNNVYETWTDFSNDDIQAYYAFSNNNGTSWSSPINLNSLLGTAKYYLMPNVSADNGKMAISFYVVDKTSKEGKYYIVSSADAGQTLESAVELSTNITNFTQVSGDEFLGDYNTSLMIGCDVYSIWAAKSGSDINVYIGKTDICETTGITEYTTVNGNFSISDIYPNPVSDNLNVVVNSKEPQKVSISLYTISGKIVLNTELQLTKGEQELKLNISHLQKGNYILKVNNKANNIITKSIIKE